MTREFEDMLKKLSPTLRRITHRLNGHFSFFDEDDLFQEAIEHLWVDFTNGKLDHKTDSYVLQGCYFHLKNYLRTTMDKIQAISLDAAVDNDGLSLGDRLAKEDHNIADCLDSLLLGEAVKKRRLTAREGGVLSLSMDGFTTREIGQKLGISHVMVIKLKRRMRDKFEIFKRGYQN